MRNERAERKPVSSNRSSNNKDRRGDTGRTSNQGRKESSGGIKESNNKGNKKDWAERM